MNIREWTLPVYSILMQLGTGAFLALWILRAIFKEKYGQVVVDRMSRYPLLIIFITIVAAVVGSHFHLSKPYFSILAVLNFRSSWLSREIAFNILYLISVASLLDLVWFGTKRERWKTALGWVAITFGMSTVFCMGRIYLLPSQAGWNTSFTILSFYGSTLLVGLLSLALLMMLDLKFAQLQAVGDIIDRKSILEKSFMWFALTAVFITAAIIAINYMHIASLRGGDETALTSLQLLLGLYQPLFAMRIIAIVAGTCLLVLAFYLLTYRHKPINDLLTPVYASCLFVMIGEILGRFLFYATHVRIGI